MPLEVADDVIHGALLSTDQSHDGEDAVTVTVPFPPVEGAVADNGVTENVQD